MNIFSLQKQSRAQRMASLITVLLFVLVFSQVTKAHDPAVSLTGSGTATIDGTMNSGEWDSAGRVSFLANIPGGTAPATIYSMNDANNLYLALRIQRPVMDSISMGVEFDNDHDGVREPGDDVVAMNTSPFGPPSVYDVFRSPCPFDPTNVAGCSGIDTDNGGTMDAVGAASNDGTYTVIEISRPLNSADDAHDFSLNAGDTIGFSLYLFVYVESVGAVTLFPTCPSCAYSFGDLVIANPVTLVSLDFKSKIKVGSAGNLPVAILTTSSFNANTVNPSTVRFGLTGQEAAPEGWSFIDVDGDGDLDLQLRFRINATGIKCGANTAVLTGKTFGNQAIRGSGPVVTTGCP